ncbi:MAG: thiamine phosphate synthase [Pseudomonadota bacterium]
MKFFAITPEYVSCKDIVQYLPVLKDKGVAYVYIRSSRLYDDCETIVAASKKTGIMPIIPLSLSESFRELSAGIHFKSFEADLLTKELSSQAPVITAACHDFETAVTLLQGRADYVFVSPVFKPLSKQEDSRELFPRDKLCELIGMFGERVVALGGMTDKRILELHSEAGYDFSAAGITMFFNN